MNASGTWSVRSKHELNDASKMNLVCASEGDQIDARVAIDGLFFSSVTPATCRDLCAVLTFDMPCVVSSPRGRLGLSDMAL